MRISDWSSDVCSSDLTSILGLRIVRNSKAPLLALWRTRMTRFTVNGNPVEYLVDPGTPLLWALRDASHLTGAKYGCDDASCGACTVIADGEAVRACTVSITAMEGRFITTIEALSPARNHPLQQIGRAHV